MSVNFIALLLGVVAGALLRHALRFTAFAVARAVHLPPNHNNNHTAFY